MVFPEPWPRHHPHHCYYLHLVRLCILIILSFLLVEVEARVSSKGCLDRERDALLLLKAVIQDPSSRLSSWRAQADCCAWTGVVCHNTTGGVRVAELNLRNPNCEEFSETGTELRGEPLHPSLLSLTHLQSLDLSCNDFESSQIPPIIGSLHKLRYLDLSWSNFSGTIPPHLGNLTHLRHLDLSDNYAEVVHSLDWLSGLSSLIYLDMSYLFSDASHNLLSAILDVLPSLQQLKLRSCSINNNIPLSLDSPLNLTNSLTALDLSWNNFNSFPNWLWNLTGLSSLHLDNSEIQGTLPDEIGNLMNLVDLDLSWNLLSGPFPDAIWRLNHLANLNLSFNLFGNSLPVKIMNLSSLSELMLVNSSLTGLIPSEIGNLTTLNAVSLRSNSLSGSIPVEIWKLVSLNFLDLSVNSIEGEISEFHLSNLTKLKALIFWDNPFIAIAIKHTWTPPFQLQILELGSFKLGPKFPAWLRNQQSITDFTLYNTSIEGNLPEWFWNSFSKTIAFLDLSYNKIKGSLPTSLENLAELSFLNLRSNLLEGPIPHFPPNLGAIDLSVNAFSGPLPSTLFMPYLEFLSLSYNHVNGSIPSEVFNSSMLEYLSLSNNQISGEISRCWRDGGYLHYINLGNNMLHGEIPSSLGNLMRLKFLHLNDNNLKGRLPSALQNCKQLVTVDLGDNKLYGNIPLWIGQSWKKLRVLRLRSNMFNGYIDPQLGYLKDLQIIDLANNKLSGPIPHSFGNFTAMISTSAEQLPRFYSLDVDIDNITLVTKGGQFPFSSILFLMKSIDLSNNGLTDEIPQELGHLIGLNTLNLSRNYFRGEIPESIGGMSSLETLDLSFNNLSGSIPQSLSQLNALNHLNMSYNNLSGSVPHGHQLQTLDDVTIYIGNPYLCGDIVNKSCFLENNINVTSEEHVVSSPLLSIYFSSALGYFIGLWSVFVLLLFKKNWRVFYFNKVDGLYDKVYVAIKIRLNRIANV